MSVNTFNRSFAGGEISPQLYSRLDLDKFQTGLSLCLNMETLPQGPVQNRPGYGYVLNAKHNDLAAVLIPFSFSTEQTFALEFGDHYVRFHTNGGTLLEDAFSLSAISSAPDPFYTTTAPTTWAVGDWVFLSNIPSMPLLNNRWARVTSETLNQIFQLEDLWGNPIDTSAMPVYLAGGTMARLYELSTPYAHADLRTIKYVQSSDVLTLVSPLYPPAELRRLSPAAWTLSDIQFAPTLSPPQASGDAPVNILHRYAVQGFVPEVGLNNVAAGATCMNDLTLSGYFNRIGWSPQSGATKYFIYKLVGASWLLIGTSPGGSGAGNTFDDFNYTPDPSVSLSGPITLPALTTSATAVAPAVGAGISVVPTGAGAIPYSYVVTSVSNDGKEESIASPSATASNDLNISGQFNTVSWPAVPGVSRYNVYRKAAGAYSFVGIGDPSLTFVDQNIAPDVTITPPYQTSPFQGTGNYPRAVTYYQQRRVFASTNNAPQKVWMTRSGTEKNFSYSTPSRADDAVIFQLVSREANTIRSMVPMNELVLLTSGGEWKLGASDDTPVSPANIPLKPQGYTGTFDVQPASTDRTILYPQARGGFVREIVYAWEQSGYKTSDVSILAPHLFQYRTVVQMAFSRAPLPALWSVRSDGVLLGMTYVTEQEIRAWHQHTTAGTFESVCSIAEGDEDVVYVIVKRRINSIDVRYVERKHTRRFDTAGDQFFVDSGATYDGAPADTIIGLYHLEGEDVTILADGGVEPNQTVVNGQITIEAPASKVQVGLGYVSQMRTLPLTMQTQQAFGQGLNKNVNKVYLRVTGSPSFKVGPNFDQLRQAPTRFQEPYGSPPSLIEAEVVELDLDPEWQEDGFVCVQQDQPLALTVSGMTIETATGG